MSTAQNEAPKGTTAPGTKHGTERSPERDRLLPLMFKMGRLMKGEISREGMPLPSYLHVETLRFIQERIEEGRTPSMSDVAEYLHIAPPSATALINGFVKDGVLDRVEDPEDRRRVRLSISAKGARLLEETIAKRANAFSRVFDQLSDQDCSEFARILTIITRDSDS